MYPYIQGNIGFKPFIEMINFAFYGLFYFPSVESFLFQDFYEVCRLLKKILMLFFILQVSYESRHENIDIVIGRLAAGNYAGTRDRQVPPPPEPALLESLKEEMTELLCRYKKL